MHSCNCGDVARLATLLGEGLRCGRSIGRRCLRASATRTQESTTGPFLLDRRLDYRVEPERRAAFAEAARKLLPEIADEDLEPDISGIRPKLQAKGAPARDFVIAEERERGLPGFVNLLGIESPGLTAAPAIADYVATLLRG